MAGLLDFLDTEDGRLGLGLLAAAGPSMTPMSFGQRLAGAMQGYRAERTAAEERALKKQLAEAQIGNYASEAEYRKAQAEAQRQDAAMKAAEMQRAQAVQQWRSSLFQPTTPEQALAGGGGPTQANAAQIGAGPDPQALLERVRQGVAMGLIKPEDAKAIIESRDWGRPEIASWQDVPGGPTGVQRQGVTKFGEQVGQLAPKPVEMKVADTGGKLVGYNGYNGSLTGFNIGKEQSPDSKASNAVAWANHGLNAQRLAMDRDTAGKPQYHDGQWVLPPSAANPSGSAVPVPGYVKPMSEGQKKQAIGIDALRSATDEYIQGLNNWGKTDMASPNARAQMGTLYNNMMLQAKEAYNLGVLNGPDYKILTSIVSDPTSPSSLLVSNDVLRNQAVRLKQLMAGTEKAVRAGGAPSADEPAQKPTQFKMLPPAAQYPGSRMRSDDGTIYRSDGNKWTRE